MKRSSSLGTDQEELQHHLSSAFEFTSFDQLYLATKSNHYKLNARLILKLTDNLLFRNKVLNQEIEILYPNYELILGSKHDSESDLLLDKCLENSIDHEFVLKVLWQHIYIEPIVMKFISMRYSNYATNLFAFGQFSVSEPNRPKNKWPNDFFYFI